MTDGCTSTNRTAILVLAGTGAVRPLHRGLGRRGEASLREAMLRKTISTVRRGRSGAEVFVSLDPAAPAPTGTVALPQRGEDFEARLIDALERVFVRGYERVVTVVTDTPSLRARDLVRAVRAPQDVLRQGPAPDGGLYLMTIRHAHLDRLRGLPWGTPRLRQHFVRALAETADHGSRLRWLPSRADVDRPEDVRRFDTVLRDLCSRYSDPLVLSPSDLVRCRTRPVRTTLPSSIARLPGSRRGPPNGGAPCPFRRPWTARRQRIRRWDPGPAILTRGRTLRCTKSFSGAPCSSSAPCSGGSPHV